MPATTAAAARPRSWPAMLAWALLALELLLFATYPWVDHLLRQAGRPDLKVLAPFAIPPTVAALTAGVVGAVLASRRPRHPVGCLLAMGLDMAVSGASVGYISTAWSSVPGCCLPPTSSPGSTRRRSRRPWPRSGSSCCSPPPGRRRRPAGAGGPGLGRRGGRHPGRGHGRAGSLDPLAQFVDGPLDPDVYGGALRVANQLALLVGLLTILAGAGSLVVRFRHARGVERQQLRWVALAAALTGMAMLAAGILIAAGEVNLGAWASVFGVAVLPVAIGAAILRYRL
jgi:hypothetical protein